jgi:hypothetical protein
MADFCAALHNLFNQLEHFKFPFELNKIPRNGIYILFEDGEQSHDLNRIVRIGSHRGINQLRSRLQQHFIKKNKDRSIFRKNIGRAILNRSGDSFLEQWNWDLTTRKAKDTYSHLVDWCKQEETEKQVTAYIQGHFSFVVFGIAEKTKRLSIESKIISTVSWCKDCHPSYNWLGLHSPKPKICQSGLWLVNELYKEPLSEVDLAELKELVQKVGGNK